MGMSFQQQMLKMTANARPQTEKHRLGKRGKDREREGRKNINTINTN